MKRTTGGTAVTYEYGDSSWKDLLTKYNGQSITYDAIGNPLMWGNRTFTWTAGRRLSSVTIPGKNISYTYGADGYRTSKTVNGVTTTYYLDGGRISALKRGSDELSFVYDENGDVTGGYYNGTPFAYAKNLQGDIIGIIDQNCTWAVTYEYDAWGKLLSTTGSLASTLGVLNPFRYRSYNYDEESGLYYLNSRYYDPEVGRFLNADGSLAGVGGDVQGYNLFAYCFDNPVNMSDSTGNWPRWMENVGKEFVKGVSTIQPGGYVPEVGDQSGLIGIQIAVRKVLYLTDELFGVVDDLVDYVAETTILGQFLIAALVPVLGELDVGPIIADPAEYALVPGGPLDDGILLDGDLTDHRHG